MQLRSVLAAFAIAPAVCAAQSYPSKPIRLVYPTIPGSAFELYGRLVAQKMSETLGRPIVGENRAGAGGRLYAALGDAGDPRHLGVPREEHAVRSAQGFEAE